MALQGRYREEIRLVVVDVDHTLFDWTRTWALTYRGLLESTTRLTGVALDTLLDELGALHRAEGSSEVADPLQRLPGLTPWHAGNPRRLRTLTEAWHAAVASGEETLAPYPGVPEMLSQLHGGGTPVVACSETDATIVTRRLRALGLAEFISALAVPRAAGPDAGLPLLETGAEKPDPVVLQRICDAVGVVPQHATCVGDHLYKDVLMARRAGMADVWAQYGTTRAARDLALLDRLRHWRSATVDPDRFGHAPEPTWTLARSLLELRNLFEFGRPR